MNDQQPKVIFLIGFMGSGKSHEGALLAQQLNIPLIDLDNWIEEQQGKTISEVFKTEGEEYFRDLEANALKDATGQLIAQSDSGIGSKHFAGIIATGGGTPCFHGSMDWMNDHGITVWFNLPVQVLANRLSKEKSKRPLIAALTDDQMNQFIADKLKERYPYYSKAKIIIADLIDASTLIQKITNA
jgi:shikimate kinase